MNAPIGGDDDCKKDNERERIEKHGGRAICLFKSHGDCQYILPDLTGNILIFAALARLRTHREIFRRCHVGMQRDRER
jgi:hypothetical protein